MDPKFDGQGNYMTKKELLSMVDETDEDQGQ